MRFRTLHSTFLTATLLSCSAFAALAQAPAPPPEWVPQGVTDLGMHASSRTEFTFDHSMIVMASKMIDKDDQTLQRVIAGISGIAVHRFQYPGPGFYDPAAIGYISKQYHDAGWKHMVSKRNRDDHTGVSDLWLRFDDAKVTSVAFVVAGPTQLNFIAVSGALSPLDLFHLSGHFGIPQFEDSHDFVAAPDSRR